MTALEPESSHWIRFHGNKSGVVAGGFERAIKGIEAEIRPEVEAKHADEWNTCGLLKRWFMLRRIEREIAEQVAQRSQHISPDSLF